MSDFIWPMSVVLYQDFNKNVLKVKSMSHLAKGFWDRLNRPYLMLKNIHFKAIELRLLLRIVSAMPVFLAIPKITYSGDYFKSSIIHMTN